jgi:hypothetical protein
MEMKLLALVQVTELVDGMDEAMNGCMGFIVLLENDIRFVCTLLKAIALTFCVRWQRMYCVSEGDRWASLQPPSADWAVPSRSPFAFASVVAVESPALNAHSRRLEKRATITANLPNDASTSTGPAVLSPANASNWFVG